MDDNKPNTESQTTEIINRPDHSDNLTRQQRRARDRQLTKISNRQNADIKRAAAQTGRKMRTAGRTRDTLKFFQNAVNDKGAPKFTNEDADLPGYPMTCWYKPALSRGKSYSKAD